MPLRRSRLSTRTTGRAVVATGNPDLDAALRSMEARIDEFGAKMGILAGPGQRPTGPTDVGVAVRHKSFVVTFRQDAVEVSVRVYRVWRAFAGTTAAPTTPSSATGSQVGTVAPTWLRPDPNDDFSFVDTDITDAELTAPESRFMYWVSTLDVRGRESPRIPISGGPVACLA